MAPIRRYLRISKYSVLECRIYLDNPALAESWLLNSRNPILPRVIESVRPLVLPKLLEEKERSKGKGGKKKKAVKDIVVEDDFEVSIFLTDMSIRHSLLTKQKFLRDPNKKSLVSNSQKLMGATADTAMEVEDLPIIRSEESEEDALNLHDLPAAEEEPSDTDSLFVAEDDGHGRSKRPRAATNTGSQPESSPDLEPLQKRRKDGDLLAVEEEGDEKKKMAMDTSYDGFAIYGSALCLVVKRKDRKGKGATTSGAQAMMEDWIISTQMPPQEVDEAL